MYCNTEKKHLCASFEYSFLEQQQYNFIAQIV